MHAQQEGAINSKMQCTFTQPVDDTVENPFKLALDVNEPRQIYHPLTTGRKTQ
jgi:hypothetical protein